MNLKKLGGLALATALTIILAGCDSTSETLVTETDTTTSETIIAAMYVASNNTGSNSVLSYIRDASGTLTFSEETATGGSGSGIDSDSCGNSIYLDNDTGLLYVVNSGSNSITLFLVNADSSLSQLDVINTGGVNPVSVAVNFNVVYVLNAGDANTDSNIKGFLVSEGEFLELADGEANLTTSLPGASKIEFAPAGTLVTVTEPNTDTILSFTLDASFANPTITSSTSVGTTPSGFDYTPAGSLVVAESFADAVDAGAVSSYSVGQAGTATPITSSLALSQTGSNCVKVVSSGAYALIGNSGSDNISVVNVAADASLTISGDLESTGDAPRDIATSLDDSFVYVLNSDDDSVSIFSFASGELTSVGSVTGLPIGARGITGR